MHTDSVSARPDLALAPARDDDFEALLALRLAAMRESLERAGHFDPARARERLSRGYQPAHTRHILRHGELVGFVVVVPRAHDWLIDHLYIHPSAQGEGIGSWVLSQVLDEADAARAAVSVTALKHSEANRLYQRHGFALRAEGEWDSYYQRAAR